MVNLGMRKTYAIELLGGSIGSAAETLGVTYQAVAKWPDELTDRIVGNVVMTLIRRGRRVHKDFLASAKAKAEA